MRQNIRLMSGAIAVVLLFGIVAAAERSPYVGEEVREIKSLSDEDIVELQSGGGWGFAKAAELNGIPGPIHLLQLQKEIPLQDDQVLTIQTIYSEMQHEAIERGSRLVELERDLEFAFRDHSIDEGQLRRFLENIGEVRTELRFIHLSRHLQMLNILSDRQIQRYNSLRGYSHDACARAPDGHDSEKWWRHNDCE